MTDFPILALRSVELQVPDLASAHNFYCDIWGLASVARIEGCEWFRASGNDPYVLRLTEGDVGVVSITFRAADDTDLTALRDRMIAAGGTQEGEIAPLDEEGGGTGFSVRDSRGRLYRIVQSDARLAPISCEAMPDRLAHVNINTADIDRDIRFFEEGLGFRLTDRSAKMGFLRTNDDHHAVVLAMAPIDTLNHIAFNHQGWEDVMLASGRMCDAGYPIGWGPGRHGPGDNVFVYFVDPFGIVVEHTAEVLIVDDSYRVGTPDDWVWPKGRVDQWGIAPAKREDCVQAQLAIPFV
ncbi:VOC family protein [Celeribacter sp. ULVN23_4]